MSPAKRCGRRLRIALFHTPPHPLVLLAAAGLPTLLAAWAVLSPGLVLARQGAVDFLFNLAGAWAIANGHMPHIDFHEAVGPLNFILTAAGFRLAGVGPAAFLAGEAVALAALFAAAVPVAMRRLPLAPAVTFVLFAALPAIVPLNPGNVLDSYSFAMSYNRYGWSGIGILSLILFVPPRGRRAAAVDPAIGALLMIAMFYVKITYFLVGLGAIGLGLVVSPHVRAARRAWAGVAALLLANAAAPYSHPYLADVGDAIRASAATVGPGSAIRLIFGNGAECALYATGVLACWLLWRRGLARPGLPAAAAFLVAAGLALLSQNTQAHGLSLGLVIAFLLYDTLARHRRTRQTIVLAGLLLAPALAVGASVTVIAGYHFAASRPATLWMVDRTALAGFAAQRGDNASRPQPAQIGYVATLIEAADLFAGGRRDAGRLRLFDRINPLPFMLGVAPLRGGYLWWEYGMPPLPADDFLGEADHVLIPKQPSQPALTQFMAAHYRDYLAAHFPHRQETPGWTLLSRTAPQP